MIIQGSVAEWSKALVLGTSHFYGVGSNPTAARVLTAKPFSIFLMNKSYVLFQGSVAKWSRVVV